MRVVRIGICGWGNVATGMFKAIAENKTVIEAAGVKICLLYTSPSPRDRTRSRMPSSA